MAAVVLLVTLFGTATIVAAQAPSAPMTLASVQFTAIDPAAFGPPMTVTPPAEPLATLPPAIADFGDAAAVRADDVIRLAPPAAAGKTATPKSQSKVPPMARITHRVRGVATWYCKRGVSSCHYAHRGGMYAAAGAEIRKGDWRGRRVQVCSGGACIRVTLIDWCACAGSRVIDLYSDAYRRLDALSSGTMRVTVGW